MSQSIQEYFDSGGQPLRVDRDLGVIQGVKLLGIQSRNGRRYLESALAEAAGLYEGAKVNVNHPKGHPLSPRDYQDRIGVIRGVRLRPGDGLFGDLHYNPKHSLSEQLVWDAEHAAQNVGLSHNVLARTVQHGKETVVEGIAKVHSVDLVADPATSRGLFEHDEAEHSGDGPPDDTPMPNWDAVTVEQVRLHRPDIVEQLQQGRDDELAQYERRLDELAASEAVARRRERILELLSEHDLPSPNQGNETARHIVSESFIESLMKAQDDEQVARLVAERAAIVKSAGAWTSAAAGRCGRPQSRDQVTLVREHGCDRVNNAEEFAAAIRG